MLAVNNTQCPPPLPAIPPQSLHCVHCPPGYPHLGERLHSVKTQKLEGKLNESKQRLMLVKVFQPLEFRGQMRL